MPPEVIELLFWSGCPSHPRALADLRAALAELGADPAAVAEREVTSDEQARVEDFVGSPSIRVGGRDLFDTGGEPPGLTCRIYRRPNGQASPTPDPDELRRALRAALKDDHG
ncbi:MAG: hypothetical protein JWM71_252 [Solirubrobacteraceae bacterium]|nr:hypothetical protein [Solirubrobacteraceae bacterium]